MSANTPSPPKPITLVYGGSTDFFQGYSASHIPPEEGGVSVSPYRIQGQKKQWFLIRNSHDESLLFPASEELGRGEPKIKGVTWFRETIMENEIRLTAVR